MKVPEFLGRNPFNVLGVPTTASITDVRRRADHLLSLSKIDETDRYDSDLGDVADWRKADAIKDSLAKLTSSKDRLTNAFFWFDLSTKRDGELAKMVLAGQHREAADEWHNEFSRTKNWIAKKNAALARCLVAFDNGKPEHFDRAATAWGELWASDAFWKFYAEYYAMHDDIGTSPALFSEFRVGLPESLSGLLADIYTATKSPRIIQAFFKEFKAIGTTAENKILGPLTSKLDSRLNHLESLIEQKSISSAKPAIDQALAEVKVSIDALNELGLSEYPPITVFLEKTAERMRSASVDVHNKHDDLKLAGRLLELGAALSNSHTLKAAVAKDRRQLRINEFGSMVVAKMERLKDGTPKDRYEGVFELLETTPIDEDIREDVDRDLLNLKRRLVCEYAMPLFDLGHAKVKSQDEIKAAAAFGETQDLISRHISIFDVNQEKIVEFARKLSKDCAAIRNPDQIAAMDGWLKEVGEATTGLKADEWSKLAALMLCQSAIWKEGSLYLRRLRHGQWMINVGWWTVWFYGIGIPFFIAGFLYRRKVF